MPADPDVEHNYPKSHSVSIPITADTEDEIAETFQVVIVGTNPLKHHTHVQYLRPRHNPGKRANCST